MGAAFNDAAAFQDDDAVAVADSGEAVGNDEGRAVFHQGVHASLHEFLGAGVDAAGRLIEDEHGRIGYGGTRNGQQLALTLAEVSSVGIEDGMVAVAQAAYETVGIDQLGCLDTFLISG